METLKMYNGNKQETIKDLPKLIFITKYINEIALAHIEKQTGLVFIKEVNTRVYSVQPISSNQIVRLFLTYNFKSKYYDNSMYHNTLFLKSDYHVGFDVDSICLECCIKNNIYVSEENRNNKDFRLSC